jgi:predicted metallo-beta-lactamase superfamily hydrolase
VSIGALKDIQVTPLAAESLGVRSMCTFVQTDDVAILLDAGISLCPWRFSLPPHPLEFQTIHVLREKIAKMADKAQIVTLSHYHYDHHTPFFEDWMVNWTTQTQTARQIYQDKILLVKHPKESINKSQQERALAFLKTCGDYAKTLQEADNKTFTYGNTNICFSKAVAHGEDNASLGYVIMTTIEYKNQEKFMFAPDIQGPMSNHTLQLILETQPNMLMLGGPPFYLADTRIKKTSIQNAITNLKAITKTIPITIIEHHTLRDELFKQKLCSLKTYADQAGHNILTAAEYIGQENNLLEAQRKSLYQTSPPTEKFQTWQNNLNLFNKNQIIPKPPIF